MVYTIFVGSYWFKRRNYGWGWTPATWQGWSVIVVYLVAVLLAGINAHVYQGNVDLIRTSFIPEVFFYTIILLIISFRTGESPSWQWGKKKNKA